MKTFLAVLWLALVALAQPVAAAQPAFPKLSGRVVDEAHLLTPPQVVDLTSKSQALEAQSGRQLVVVTLPSLQGETIEDYGYQLGRAWGLGSKDKDDGVILIVAPNERKVRIETGYGATAFLTDAMSSVIIRNSILPYFKKQPPDYGGGIIAGADQVITQMSLPPAEAAKRLQQAEAQQKSRNEGDGGVFYVFLAIFIFMFFIRPLLFGRRGRRFGRGPVVIWGPGFGGSSWDGGGSSFGGGGGGSWGGGGGFSGGGGSFGGGGASGSW